MYKKVHKRYTILAGKRYVKNERNQKEEKGTKSTKIARPKMTNKASIEAHPTLRTPIPLSSQLPCKKPWLHLTISATLLDPSRPPYYPEIQTVYPELSRKGALKKYGICGGVTKRQTVYLDVSRNDCDVLCIYPDLEKNYPEISRHS